MIRLLTLAVLAIGALGAWNIARGGSDEPASRQPAPAPHDYREAVAADARALANQTTSFQRRILADGEVTYGEYAAATRASVDCLRDSDLPFRVSGPTPQPGRQLEFSWRLAEHAENDERIRADAMRTYQRCMVAWEADVNTIYANQRVIPEPERPPVLARVVSCLRRAGVTGIPAKPSMIQLVAAIDRDHHQRGDACVKRHFDFFRMPTPVRPARELPMAR